MEKMKKIIFTNSSLLLLHFSSLNFDLYSKIPNLDKYLHSLLGSISFYNIHLIKENLNLSLLLSLTLNFAIEILNQISNTGKFDFYDMLYGSLGSSLFYFYKFLKMKFYRNLTSK